MFPLRHWLRHTAMVPKGFLRYKVLKLLKEKPMAGSEIMGVIEEQTGGYWRPSPGSIYPLLAWLQDKGYIREIGGEAGIKRYTLTDQGKSFLDGQEKVWETLQERFRHVRFPQGFPRPLGGFDFGFGFGFPPEKPIGLEKAMGDLAMALWKLQARLRWDYSEKALEEAKKALEEAARMIEAIASKKG
ncbi:PadR family transcriptional regulator [Candidatus Bathyarchaeota archaeon]|nr:PadR family transcriptional regulator [Candidatus Bathyarchaeota archaeon]